MPSEAFAPPGSRNGRRSADTFYNLKIIACRVMTKDAVLA